MNQSYVGRLVDPLAPQEYYPGPCYLVKLSGCREAEWKRSENVARNLICVVGCMGMCKYESLRSTNASQPAFLKYVGNLKISPILRVSSLWGQLVDWVQGFGSLACR